jgi:hypothetical protein
MEDEGAEIRELRPGDEVRSILINDRWGTVDPAMAREEAERVNRHALRRILESEMRHSLPALEQAVVDVERGRQLVALAGLAGDPDREEELASALDRIVEAAGSCD